MFVTTMHIGDQLTVKVDGRVVATITVGEKSGRRIKLQCEAQNGATIAKNLTPDSRKTG